MGVQLTSPLPGLTVILEHTTEKHDNLGGKRIVDPGKKIVFKKGMAEVPDDWMPVIEKNPAFTGEGTMKTIYLLSEAVALPGIGMDGPRIVTGAVGAPVKAPEPPHMDWDGMTPKEIRELVKDWGEDRLMGALAWELNRKKRREVTRAIGDLMTTVEGVELPAEPEPEPEAMARTHSATIPGPDGLG